MLVVPVFAQVENTGMQIQSKEGYWKNYFDYGDIVYGEAYYYDESISLEKINEGLADIYMITPLGDKITFVHDVPIIDSYVKFEIPITDDFSLGKYVLRVETTVNGVTTLGDYQGIFYVAQNQHFKYTGEGGPLTVEVQYIEYELSPLIFDIDSKSLSFDFKRLNEKFTSSESLQFDNNISLVIQRPLISPPFTIILEPDNDETLEYQIKPYKTRITDDGFYKYKVVLDEKWNEGTVTIIGTYVIPEFQTITMMILTLSILPIILLRKYTILK